MKKKERKKRIEEEVRKTLECFGQIERLESSPSFFTRLQARIRGLEEKPKHYVIPIFSVGFLRTALLVLIVVLNLVFSILILQQRKSQSENRNEYLSTLALFYDLNESKLELLHLYQ